MLYTFTKAGIGLVPGGGSAMELLSLVLAPSLEKRRDKWREDTATELKALQTKVDGFKIENLKENEAFVDVALHSWQIAMRCHQEEKLKALRNAVLNAALPGAPEEDLQHMFLTFVDSFTPWHITILRRLDDSEVIYNEENLGGFFPELEDRQDFCSQIIRDLHSCGLTPLLHSSDDMLLYRRQPIEHNVTRLGKQFLQFITSPP